MKRGYTLVETVIYIFLFTLLALAVTNALQSFIRSFALIQSSTSLESVADTALERMVREIRGANNIDASKSMFDGLTGALQLNTTDLSGNAITLQFYVSGGAVRIKQNGIDIGPLTGSSTNITLLKFTSTTTPKSTGIRIEMTAESGTSTSYKTRSFVTSAVLRGSYAP